jgi:hypothetical protein
MQRGNREFVTDVLAMIRIGCSVQNKQSAARCAAASELQSLLIDSQFKLADFNAVVAVS